MEWIQFISMMLALLGIYLSIRSETREIQKETKEFHGRLCSLEEKYIQMMKEQQEMRTMMFQNILEGRK